MQTIEAAIDKGYSALNEYESKKVLAAYGIPVVAEAMALEEKQVIDAADAIGYPVVVKACSRRIVHKTERNVVYTGVREHGEAVSAFRKIRARLNADNMPVLVQQMVEGKRELMAGMQRDPQFGPCVAFGLGGIFTEIFRDVSFRTAPLTRDDALEMMREIRNRRILDAFRGMPAVDRERTAGILVALGKIGMEHPRIQEIDVNPLIVSDTTPVAVDAMIILAP